METIIIKTDNAENANLLVNFLKNLQYVKSIILKKREESNNKPLTDEEWIKPGRLANKEEIESLIYKSEKSPTLTVEESKDHAYKIIDKWHKESK